MKTATFSLFTTVALMKLLAQVNAAPLNVTNFEASSVRNLASSTTMQASTLDSTESNMTSDPAIVRLAGPSVLTSTSTPSVRAVADAASLHVLPMIPAEDEQNPPLTTTITPRSPHPQLVGQQYPRSAPPTCMYVNNILFLTFYIDALRSSPLDSSRIKHRLKKCGAVTGFNVAEESKHWYIEEGLFNDDGSVDQADKRWRVKWNLPQLTKKGMRCVEEVVREEIGEDVEMPCVLAVEDWWN